MGSILEIIRYSLSGYMLLANAIYIYIVKVPDNEITDLIKEYDGIVGLSIIVVAPLLGFLVHQLYFLYFDWRESYSKDNRGCIKYIYKVFRARNPEKANIISANKAVFISWVTWELMTKGIYDDYKVPDLFITRLRSLRNYSHAFGAIITSCMICVVAALVAYASDPFGGVHWHLLLHFVCGMLFVVKRIEIMHRINVLEVSLVVANHEKFTSSYGIIQGRIDEDIELLPSIFKR